MDTIYLILLFVAPGMVVRYARNSSTWSKPRRVNIYDFLFTIVAPSIVISTLAILTLNVLKLWKTPTIDQVLVEIKDFSGLGQFSVTALVMGAVGYFAWHKLLKKRYLAYRNKALSTRHLKHFDSCVWDTVLSFDDIADTWQVVSIYNNDKYVTSGMLMMRDTSDYENIDLLLEYTDKVEELKKARPELFINWYDYYNPANGLRVVFYEQKIIQEHWKDYFTE